MLGDLCYAVTLAAALGSGLMAGIFFAFSTFVMQAFAKLPVAQGIAAMQSINVAVVNLRFMTVFLGTALLCVAVAVLALLNWREAASVHLLMASLLYVFGAVGVTMRFNVPRNNRLAAVAPHASEAASVWAEYLRAWSAWNHVRTLASFAASALLTSALMR